MKDFALGAVVLACIGFAFYIVYVNRAAPTTASSAIAGAALLCAVACAVPMRFEKFVNGVRRVVPLLDRRTGERQVPTERRGDGS